MYTEKTQRKSFMFIIIPGNLTVCLIIVFEQTTFDRKNNKIDYT